MADYLLIGGIFFVFFGLGMACVVWPRQMRWMTRSIWTLSLSESAHNWLTRIVGMLLTVSSLILLFMVWKNR